MRHTHARLPVGKVCRWLGRSRQTFYCAERLVRQRAFETTLIIKFVAEARLLAGDKVGTKKLRHLIAEPLARAQIRCGRDRLFAILRQEGLLIKQKRARRPSTTDPSGWRTNYPDLREGLRAGGAAALQPERLWVADITYLRLAASTQNPQGSFCYAHLITDAYSRKIVGAFVSPSMHADHTLKALTRALDARQYPDRELVHHSDRGSQYRADIYTITLAAAGVRVSMTQAGCPYDNALAESVNGQLKGEYGLDGEFADLVAVEYALGEAIDKYNNYRPHGSLGLATPAEVHARPQGFATFEMAWGKLPSDVNERPDAAPGDNPNPDAAPGDNPKPDTENHRQLLSELT